jgi:hypothetical protein
MVKGKALSLLVELGLDRKPHSSDSFMTHLCNTYELLRAWGRPEYLCLAGLFHGIYGTESYVPRSFPLKRRKHLRSLIGEKSEFLVYLFCIGDERPFFRPVQGQSTRIRNRLDGTELTIPSETWRDLAEIEAANWLEQLPRYTLHQDSLEKLQSALESARETVSPIAYENLRQALIEKGREQPSYERKIAHSLAKRSRLLKGVVTGIRRFRLSRA